MYSEPINNKLTIPIELLEFACHNKLDRALMVFMYLKCYTNGFIHHSSALFQQLKSELGIKDERSFKKYLSQLISLKWIGFNKATGNYLTNSISQIRSQYQFYKRAACSFFYTEIKDLKSKAIGAILSKQINVRKYLNLKRKETKWVASIKRDEGFQPIESVAKFKEEYFGFSNSVIAKIFKCSQTRACQLKKQAEKAGFIQVNHKFNNLMILPAADNYLREQLYSNYPHMKGRITFIKQKNGNVNAVEQLFDEIIPQVQIKRLGGVRG
jgi:hypothetical protein